MPFSKLATKVCPFRSWDTTGQHASIGQTDKAFAELATEAVKQGYSHPDQINADPDLASLRSTRGSLACSSKPGTIKRLAITPRRTGSSISRSETGSVVTTQGAEPAGISHIERTIGDCRNLGELDFPRKQRIRGQEL